MGVSGEVVGPAYGPGTVSGEIGFAESAQQAGVACAAVARNGELGVEGKRSDLPYT